MKNLFYILRKLIGHIFTPYATPVRHKVTFCVPLVVYDHAFTVKEMEIKRKTLLNLWMSKGLQKPDRTDQNEKR